MIKLSESFYNEIFSLQHSINFYFIFQSSLLSEGPHGYMCAVNGHNQTDSNPAPPKIERIKKKKPKKLPYWHKQVNCCNPPFCV